MKKLNNKAFTIIELLIASLVFTTVLLLCLEGIIRLGKIYVKNVSISRTNQFVRSFTEEISNQLKYGPREPIIVGSIAGEYRICSSNNAYRIVYNNNTTGSIFKKNNPSCQSPITGNFFDGAENVGPVGMRILSFSTGAVTGSASLWSISIRVALGDSDLLQDDAGRLANNTGVELAKVKCKPGISGNEFCAVLGLTTQVSRRVVK